MLGRYLLQQLDELRAGQALCDLSLVSNDGTSAHVHHLLFTALNRKHFLLAKANRTMLPDVTGHRKVMPLNLTADELAIFVTFMYGQAITRKSKYDVLLSALKKLDMEYLIHESGGITVSHQEPDVKQEQDNGANTLANIDHATGTGDVNEHTVESPNIKQEYADVAVTVSSPPNTDNVHENSASTEIKQEKTVSVTVTQVGDTVVEAIPAETEVNKKNSDMTNVVVKAEHPSHRGSSNETENAVDDIKQEPLSPLQMCDSKLSPQEECQSVIAMPECSGRTTASTQTSHIAVPVCPGTRTAATQTMDCKLESDNDDNTISVDETIQNIDDLFDVVDDNLGLEGTQNLVIYEQEPEEDYNTFSREKANLEVEHSAKISSSDSHSGGEILYKADGNGTTDLKEGISLITRSVLTKLHNLIDTNQKGEITAKDINLAIPVSKLTETLIKNQEKYGADLFDAAKSKDADTVEYASFVPTNIATAIKSSPCSDKSQCGTLSELMQVIVEDGNRNLNPTDMNIDTTYDNRRVSFGDIAPNNHASSDETMIESEHMLQNDETELSNAIGAEYHRKVELMVKPELNLQRNENEETLELVVKHLQDHNVWSNPERNIYSSQDPCAIGQMDRTFAQKSLDSNIKVQSAYKGPSDKLFINRFSRKTCPKLHRKLGRRRIFKKSSRHLILPNSSSKKQAASYLSTLYPSLTGILNFSSSLTHDNQVKSVESGITDTYDENNTDTVNRNPTHSKIYQKTNVENNESPCDHRNNIRSIEKTPKCQKGYPTTGVEGTVSDCVNGNDTRANEHTTKCSEGYKNTNARSSVTFSECTVVAKCKGYQTKHVESESYAFANMMDTNDNNQTNECLKEYQATVTESSTCTSDSGKGMEQVTKTLDCSESNWTPTVERSIFASGSGKDIKADSQTPRRLNSYQTRDILTDQNTVCNETMQPKLQMPEHYKCNAEKNVGLIEPRHQLGFQSQDLKRGLCNVPRSEILKILTSPVLSMPLSSNQVLASEVSKSAVQDTSRKPYFDNLTYSSVASHVSRRMIPASATSCVNIAIKTASLALQVFSPVITASLASNVTFPVITATVSSCVTPPIVNTFVASDVTSPMVTRSVASYVASPGTTAGAPCVTTPLVNTPVASYVASTVVTSFEASCVASPMVSTSTSCVASPVIASCGKTASVASCVASPTINTSVSCVASPVLSETLPSPFFPLMLTPTYCPAASLKIPQTLLTYSSKNVPCSAQEPKMSKNSCESKSVTYGPRPVLFLTTCSSTVAPSSSTAACAQNGKANSVSPTSNSTPLLGLSVAPQLVTSTKPALFSIPLSLLSLSVQPSQAVPLPQVTCKIPITTSPVLSVTSTSPPTFLPKPNAIIQQPVLSSALQSNVPTPLQRMAPFDITTPTVLPVAKAAHLTLLQMATPVRELSVSSIPKSTLQTHATATPDMTVVSAPQQALLTGAATSQLLSFEPKPPSSLLANSATVPHTSMAAKALPLNSTPPHRSITSEVLPTSVTTSANISITQNVPPLNSTPPHRSIAAKALPTSVTTPTNRSIEPKTLLLLPPSVFQSPQNPIALKAQPTNVATAPNIPSASLAQPPNVTTAPYIPSASLALPPNVTTAPYIPSASLALPPSIATTYSHRSVTPMALPPTVAMASHRSVTPKALPPSIATASHRSVTPMALPPTVATASHRSVTPKALPPTVAMASHRSVAPKALSPTIATTYSHRSVTPKALPPTVATASHRSVTPKALPPTVATASHRSVAPKALSPTVATASHRSVAPKALSPTVATASHRSVAAKALSPTVATASHRSVAPKALSPTVATASHRSFAPMALSPTVATASHRSVAPKALSPTVATASHRSVAPKALSPTKATASHRSVAPKALSPTIATASHRSDAPMALSPTIATASHRSVAPKALSPTVATASYRSVAAKALPPTVATASNRSVAPKALPPTVATDSHRSFASKVLPPNVTTAAHRTVATKVLPPKVTTVSHRSIAPKAWIPNLTTSPYSLSALKVLPLLQPNVTATTHIPVAPIALSSNAKTAPQRSVSPEAFPLVPENETTPHTSVAPKALPPLPLYATTASPDSNVTKLPQTLGPNYTIAQQVSVTSPSTLVELLNGVYSLPSGLTTVASQSENMPVFTSTSTISSSPRMSSTGTPLATAATALTTLILLPPTTLAGSAILPSSTTFEQSSATPEKSRDIGKTSEVIGSVISSPDFTNYRRQRDTEQGSVGHLKPLVPSNKNRMQGAILNPVGGINPVIFVPCGGNQVEGAVGSKLSNNAYIIDDCAPNFSTGYQNSSADLLSNSQISSICDDRCNNKAVSQRNLSENSHSKDAKQGMVNKENKHTVAGKRKASFCTVSAVKRLKTRPLSSRQRPVPRQNLNLEGDSSIKETMINALHRCQPLSICGESSDDYLVVSDQNQFTCKKPGQSMMRSSEASTMGQCETEQDINSSERKVDSDESEDNLPLSALVKKRKMMRKHLKVKLQDGKRMKNGGCGNKVQPSAVVNKCRKKTLHSSLKQPEYSFVKNEEAENIFMTSDFVNESTTEANDSIFEVGNEESADINIKRLVCATSFLPYSSKTADTGKKVPKKIKMTCKRKKVNLWNHTQKAMILKGYKD